MRVDLRLDALAPIRRLREQVERPGQRVGGRLMAGADEGDDIGANVVFADALAGFRILRARAAASEYRWARLAPEASRRLARADDVVDRAGEEFERCRARADVRAAAEIAARRSDRADRAGRSCRNSGVTATWNSLASRPSPCENSVCSSISSATRAISSETSTTPALASGRQPLDRRARDAVHRRRERRRSGAARTAAPARGAARASPRRRPSAARCPSPGRSTRNCSASLR